MTTDPQWLARRGFDALETEGIQGLLAYIHPDFEMETPVGLAAEPQRYEGPEGVRLWFEQFDEVMDDVRVEPGDVELLVDGRVLMPLTIRARGPASGIETELISVTAATLRDDLLARLDFYVSHEDARASATPPDPSDRLR